MTFSAPSNPDGFDQSAFNGFLAGRDEPDWLLQLRRDAYATYQAKLEEPLDPEEFKRVDLRTFRPEKYGIAESVSGETSFETLMQNRGEFGGAIVQVDGKCVASTLSPELQAKGVLFGNLSEMLVEHRQLLEPFFLKRAVSAENDRFSAWHAAFWTGGSVLYVPRNVEIEAPLYSLIGLQTDGAADFSHTLIILEDGASATLLEETSSAQAGTDGLHVGVVELIVGDGARLRYVQLQNWNEKVRHFAHQSGRVGRDAMLQWTVGGLGAKLMHIHQDVHLDGRGAHAQVNGVTFATDKQLLSYYFSLPLKNKSNPL